MQHIIRTASIREVFTISSQIREFENHYPYSEFETRLSGTYSLILVCESKIDNKVIGFKVGYSSSQSKQFYTWMGGVLPAFRRKGIAKKLANKQEEMLKAENFHSIFFKTRNKHKAMLHFALSNGFSISDFEKKLPLSESRIYLTKYLIPIKS